MKSQIHVERQATGRISSGVSTLLISPRAAGLAAQTGVLPDSRGFCFAPIHNWNNLSVMFQNLVSPSNNTSIFTEANPGVASLGAALANLNEDNYGRFKVMPTSFKVTVANQSVAPLSCNIFVLRSRRAFNANMAVAAPTAGPCDPLSCANALYATSQPANGGFGSLNQAMSAYDPMTSFTSAPGFSHYFEVISHAGIRRLSHGVAATRRLVMPMGTYCPAVDFRGAVNCTFNGSAFPATAGFDTWFFVELLPGPPAPTGNGTTYDIAGAAVGGTVQVEWHENWSYQPRQKTWHVTDYVAPAYSRAGQSPAVVSGESSTMNEFGTASTNVGGVLI